MSDNLSVPDVTTTVQEAVAGSSTDKFDILKPPRVVSFGFKSFVIADKSGNKWKASCQHCSTVITEARGTTSGFVRYEYANLVCTLEFVTQ